MSDNSFVIQLVMVNQKACNPLITAIARRTSILKMHFTNEITTVSSSISQQNGLLVKRNIRNKLI